MGRNQFVNPYNFIPLGTRRAAGQESNGNLTGVIEYSVLTKTPLFIPNTSNSKTFKLDKDEVDPDHKSYDFFSYTDLSDTGKTYEKEYHRPVIPGSEIRGMFRNNYEILTNSCMSAIDDQAVLSKRTNEVYKAGLIGKNGNGTFSLYEAEDCLWRTKGEQNQKDELNWEDSYYTRKCYRQAGFPEGSKVNFDYVFRGKKIKPLAQNVVLAGKEKMPKRYSKRKSGYIIKGEDGPELNAKGEKHCCHIFKLKNTCVKKVISLDTLETVLREFVKNGVHFYTEYSEQLEQFKTSREMEYFPVYYSEIGNYTMLSPASITREIHQNKLEKLIGSFASCKDSQALCPACSLFGMLGKKSARTSRVRFTDLVCREQRSEKSCYDEIVTLKPLSSPKLNNMEFYLQQPHPNAWFWTYDYYVDSEGNVHPCTPTISGRKFYWHQMDVNLPKDVKATNLNMSVRPVTRNVTFSGKLYFENLTEKELNQLIWLLNAGEDDRIPISDRTHGYKIGAAKPLGLGSVASAVDKVLVREVVSDTEKHTIFLKEDQYKPQMGIVKFDKKISDDFLKMLSFDAVKGERVCYPIVEGSETSADNGYEWFVANHKGYSHRRTKTVDMPNSRNDMYYEKHMVSMEPGLVFTTSKIEALGQIRKGSRYDRPGGSNFGNSGPILTAIVEEVDCYGNIYIKVDNKKGSIRKPKNGPLLPKVNKNDTIKVRFLRTVELSNGSKADNYELVK